MTSPLYTWEQHAEIMEDDLRHYIVTCRAADPNAEKQLPLDELDAIADDLAAERRDREGIK